MILYLWHRYKGRPLRDFEWGQLAGTVDSLVLFLLFTGVLLAIS